MSHFSYRKDEEPLCIPSGRQPQYGKGEWMCGVCRHTFINLHATVFLGHAVSKPGGGKTETIKDGAIYVYFPRA
ncbi:MAG: hypothetical protein QXG12_03435 [Thermoproteota archaeon]